MTEKTAEKKTESAAEATPAEGPPKKITEADLRDLIARVVELEGQVAYLLSRCPPHVG